MAIIRKTKKIEHSQPAKSAQDVLRDAQAAGITILPIDIEAVLKLYGIEVLYENMNDISGYIEKRGDRWFVGVNAFNSKKRQRFTMAHELGHLCLHAEKMHGDRVEETIYFRTNLTNRMEKEANEFASNILIPKDSLYLHINKGTNKLTDLADIFDVSLDAMRYKAYTLRLISEY